MGQCSIDLLHLYDLGMDDLNADRAAVIRVVDHENLTEPLRSGASIVGVAREEQIRRKGLHVTKADFKTTIGHRFYSTPYGDEAAGATQHPAGCCVRTSLCIITLTPCRIHAESCIGMRV